MSPKKQNFKVKGPDSLQEKLEAAEARVKGLEKQMEDAKKRAGTESSKFEPFEHQAFLYAIDNDPQLIWNHIKAIEGKLSDMRIRSLSNALEPHALEDAVIEELQAALKRQEYIFKGIKEQLKRLPDPTVRGAAATLEMLHGMVDTELAALANPGETRKGV